MTSDDGTERTRSGELQQVERAVELPASVERVWRAITDPDEVAAWFGAGVEWDLRPDGPARFAGGDDGGRPRTGRVEHVEPARRLRFRWWPDDDDGAATVVTYELSPVPGGTRLTVTEAPPPPRATMRAAAPAWTSWDSRLVGLWAGCQPRRLVRA